MKRKYSIALMVLFVVPFLGADFSKIPEISGYEKWQAVTEKPVSVTPELWTLCVKPPPEWEPMNSGPHKGGWMTVRVNEVGRRVFLNERSPKFPEGTVIIKEKLLSPSHDKPDSLGVMIKESSGWEFAFVDSHGNISRGRDQVENCYSCHSKMVETDGVFRAYLSRQQNLAWNVSAANKQIHGTLKRDVPLPP